MSDDYSSLIGSSYSSGSIHFTGLGSGTDFDSMITQLMEVESQSLSNMADDYKAWETKISAIQELNSLTLALNTTISDMNTPAKFMVKTSTSSDETSLVATPGINAESGSHAIEINQLAQNHIIMSKAGFSSASASLNASESDATFAYTYNGKSITLTVTPGMTLTSLANMINNDPENPGVKAAIINDGSENGYHFQLRGMDQGQDYQVAITSAPDSMGLDFDTTQEAQNAKIKVDGWPVDADSYIERNSNSIDDVITGLTLSLKQTTAPGETITVSTGTDTAAIKDKIVTFVDQVNQVLTKIRSLTEIDTSDNSASLLTGSYTLDSMASNIKNVLTSRGIGFDPDEDSISSLIGKHIAGSNALAVGLTTDTSEGSETFGLFLLDEASLDKALQEDPEAVMEIFSADLTPTVNTSAISYHSSISGTTQSGIYDISYTVNASGEITSATIDGTLYDYANGASGKSGNTLTSLSGPSKGLAITINDLTQGTHQGTIRLKEGKTSQLSTLLGQLTNSSSGSLSILKDSYQETIENLEDRMADEQDRLQNYEQELREKFARLESTLGYYSNIQEMLTTQIKQLSSSD
ncbi:flagellar filament capping protein FliD [Desulfoplanes formicivorans]|uniref:Flagellar hook-associated protein 2 n=1 Tax=Desulfoplanes formicivorans TaxID=1592317 RepID=A0A194AFM1_9BACT|nr:flagellar filament capping protein FliD [Desulfoplanes formicivorans]GAU07574.1 flagellar hook-associated 2 domain protein [Desulfoplanes formicivorans]